MSLTRDFQRAKHRECEDKVSYATRRLAQIAADRVTRKEGKEMRTYECIWCRGFHITSRPESL